MHALKTFLQFDTNNIHLQGVGGTTWVYNIPLSPVSLASIDTCKKCEKTLIRHKENRQSNRRQNADSSNVM